MEWKIPLLQRCQCHDFYLMKKLQWGDKLKRKVKGGGEECKGSTMEVKRERLEETWFMQSRENSGKIFCEKSFFFSCFSRCFYQVEYLKATFCWTRFKLFSKLDLEKSCYVTLRPQRGDTYSTAAVGFRWQNWCKDSAVWAVVYSQLTTLRWKT